MTLGGRDVQLSARKAREEAKIFVERIDKAQKLILILDLDNTVVHATLARSNAEIDAAKSMGVHIVRMSKSQVYLVKVRQYMEYFIKHISRTYLVYIYTHGTKPYAKKILKLLDPANILSVEDDQIHSWDEGKIEVKTLRNVIPGGDFSRVLILDDRRDVWPGFKNLIFTSPFIFFDEAHRRKTGNLKTMDHSDCFLFYTTHLLFDI